MTVPRVTYRNAAHPTPAGVRSTDAIQRATQVPIVGADGVVHRDEIGAGRERALDLDLVERAADGGQDVAAAQHRRAERHEGGDRVVAIADELLEVVRDERLHASEAVLPMQSGVQWPLSD